jgi:alpha-mannosidase
MKTARMLPLLAGATWQFVALPLALFSTTCLATSPTNEPSCSASIEQVIIVFKTHFDIGYTDMASNVVHRYRTSMIDQALNVSDQNRGLPAEQQFVWTIPGWPMKKIAEVAWSDSRAEGKDF